MLRCYTATQTQGFRKTRSHGRSAHTYSDLYVSSSSSSFPSSSSSFFRLFSFFSSFSTPLLPLPVTFRKIYFGRRSGHDMSRYATRTTSPRVTFSCSREKDFHFLLSFFFHLPLPLIVVQRDESLENSRLRVEVETRRKAKEADRISRRGISSEKKNRQQILIVLFHVLFHPFISSYTFHILYYLYISIFSSLLSYDRRSINFCSLRRIYTNIREHVFRSFI